MNIEKIIYEYGIILGYDSVQCRRNKITGTIEMMYRKPNETWDSKPAWWYVRDYFKNRFIRTK